MRRLPYCFFICSALLNLGSSTYAQSVAPAIQGKVLDATTFQPIASANVTVLQAGQDISNSSTTEEGTFQISRTDEGLYQILIEARGYQPAVSGELRVIAGKTAVVNFELAPLTLSENIEVTAPAIANLRGSVTSKTYNREEIRRAPGSAGDVLRAVDSLPGVAATGQFASFSVRGRGPRDNLILVDGIPFEKVIHFDQTLGEQEDLESGGRFSIFAPNLIQNIEFQPGGFSAAYGGKSGSLLKLEVAEGNPVTPSTSGRIDVAGWEFNYDGPTYAFKNTAVLFSARAQNFGRLFRLIGQNQIGTPSLTDVIVKTTTQINERHRINLLGIYAPEDYVRTRENVLQSENFQNTFVANTSQNSGLVGLNWRWLTGNSSFLRNTVFFRDSDKRSRSGDTFPELVEGDAIRPEDIPIRDDIIDVREGEREIGWRGDFSHVNGLGHQLSTGTRVTQVSLDYKTELNGDWIRYVYDQNDFRPNPDQQFIVLRPEFVNSQFQNEAVRTALYADYSLPIGERVTVTPGLRWEYDGFADQSLWSPRANLTVDVDPRTRVTIGGGVFYQHPRFLQLAGAPLNAGLKNERSRQVTAGISRTLRSDLRVSAEGYYQALDKLVIRPDRTTGAALNRGKGHTTGIDLLLSKRLIDRWYSQLTYSFQRSIRNDNIGEGAYDSDFSRPHIFNALVAYDFNDSWALAGKWRFASGRPTDSFVIHENVFENANFLRYSKEITARNVERLPAFHTLNVRLDYRRPLGRLVLITFLDIINVYGHTNVDVLQFQERTGMIVEEGLGAFPTFGIKLEF